MEAMGRGTLGAEDLHNRCAVKAPPNRPAPECAPDLVTTPAVVTFNHLFCGRAYRLQVSSSAASAACIIIRSVGRLHKDCTSSCNEHEDCHWLQAQVLSSVWKPVCERVVCFACIAMLHSEQIDSCARVLKRVRPSGGCA